MNNNQIRMIDYVNDKIIKNDFIKDIIVYFYEEQIKLHEQIIGIGGVQDGVIYSYRYYPYIVFLNNGVEEKYTIKEDLSVYGNSIQQKHLDFFVNYLNSIILEKQLNNKDFKKKMVKI